MINRVADVSKKEYLVHLHQLMERAVMSIEKLSFQKVKRMVSHLTSCIS
jgi:hypothetical protein